MSTDIPILENKKVKKQIKEVAELAQYLWQYGWAERNAGNISVNLTHLIRYEVKEIEQFPVFQLNVPYKGLAGHYFFVTGTGKRMRDLARNPIRNASLIKIAEDGKSYYLITEKKRNYYNFRPTSELPTHLAVHEKIALRGSNEKAVVHTHPNELVGLTQIKSFQDEKKINKLLWGMHPESVVFVPKGMGLVPYILPGSEDIAAATLKKFDDHDVVMWEKHGTFAIGESVFDAFDMIDILAKSARIYFMVKQSGHEPEGLTDDQIEELLDNFIRNK
jgi:rhamnulose-1-phosphate aldolase